MQSHWSFIIGQCFHSERFLRVHLSHRMCNQFTLHPEFRIDNQEDKFSAKERRYSSRLWILWSKNTKILIQSTWKHRVLHDTCRQRGRNIKTRCIGSTSNLLKRKDLSSIRLDRTPSSCYDALPVCCIPKAIKIETGETIFRESICVTPASCEDFLLDIWMQELGSEVAWHGENSQQTQTTPKTTNPIVRTGRPVFVRTTVQFECSGNRLRFVTWLRNHQWKKRATCEKLCANVCWTFR